MKLLDPNIVKQFAARFKEVRNGSTEYEKLTDEFNTYAAEFIKQFSRHYHDFMPCIDGNIECKMEDYINPRRQTTYFIDLATGFIHPKEKDVHRGGKYQSIG